ncbi:hypothetical protein [Prosthecobacter sp.]|jgi:hypothetical protein|uniref:hypothetical protein n=1 Tax=Prosthecobacter sp. TaxID=1965333 RepID=UPI00378312BE
MRRSIFNLNTRKPHPLCGHAIHMLRQKSVLLMQQAYDAECRGQSKRSARYTSQATALNFAAACLAESPQCLAEADTAAAPLPA